MDAPESYETISKEKLDLDLFAMTYTLIFKITIIITKGAYLNEIFLDKLLKDEPIQLVNWK